MREGAQQVERRRRLAIGLDLPARIGNARFRRELDVVDDVAAIARQFDAVAASRSATSAAWRTGRRCGRPSPPATPPAKVSTTAICRNTRKKSRMLLAPCSAKLSAQSPPCSRKASPAATRASARLQLARLACKNQRRKGRELLLDVGQAPARPDNPAPARSAFCASYRASNARASHNTPSEVTAAKYSAVLARLIHETGARGQFPFWLRKLRNGEIMA